MKFPEGPKKVAGVAERREAVRFLTAKGLSVRRSCVILRISRSSLGYLPRKDDSALLRKLKELAGKNPCHGYRMMHGSLLMAGWRVNPKKVRGDCANSTGCPSRCAARGNGRVPGQACPAVRST